MGQPIATVLVPTTINRGPLLSSSIGSIQNQTLENIEILVIGDGIDEATRETIAGIQEKDKRIRFFEHPKGPRRGEIYRHKALMKYARGRIIGYLLDRDLMLPNHIETMESQLAKSNFCVTTSISVKADGNTEFLKKHFLGENIENEHRQHTAFVDGYFFFSQVGHTLELYKSLPHGWRTTPQRYATDAYMWMQFTASPNIKMVSTFDPTILYFKRGVYPGIEVKKRARELSLYYDQIQMPENIDRIIESTFKNLLLDKQKLEEANLLLRGKKPGRFLSHYFKKFLKSFSVRR